SHAPPRRPSGMRPSGMRPSATRPSATTRLHLDRRRHDQPAPRRRGVPGAFLDQVHGKLYQAVAYLLEREASLVVGVGTHRVAARAQLDLARRRRREPAVQPDPAVLTRADPDHDRHVVAVEGHRATMLAPGGQGRLAAQAQPENLDVSILQLEGELDTLDEVPRWRVELREHRADAAQDLHVETVERSGGVRLLTHIQPPIVTSSMPARQPAWRAAWQGTGPEWGRCCRSACRAPRPRPRSSSVVRTRLPARAAGSAPPAGRRASTAGADA